MSHNWKNRIIGYGMEAPDQLLANPFNFRGHPQAQQEALTGVLDDVGWVDEITVNQRTGHVVDGHLRVALALRYDVAEVPVKYIDVDEAEEKEILATLDPLSAMAFTDAAKLDELLQQVNSDQPAVQEMLAKLAEDAGLYQGGNADEAPEPQIDRAAELQQVWGVERGQLWVIPSKSGKGAHRLLCGDSTNADDVARVMQGERIDIITSDPPYGVDYDGGTTIREKLNGDGAPDLYVPALTCWWGFCADHVALYLWYADGDQAVAQAVAQAGFVVRRNLIWNKNLAQYGALSQQYKQKHEPFSIVT